MADEKIMEEFTISIPMEIHPDQVKMKAAISEAAFVILIEINGPFTAKQAKVAQDLCTAINESAAHVEIKPVAAAAAPIRNTKNMN